MRAIFAILLLIASSGLIYAGITADAPLSGIDYEIQTVEQETCRAEPTPGDRILDLVGGDSQPAISMDGPGNTTVTLLTYLTCGLLDN